MTINKQAILIHRVDSLMDSVANADTLLDLAISEARINLIRTDIAYAKATEAGTADVRFGALVVNAQRDLDDLLAEKDGFSRDSLGRPQVFPGKVEEGMVRCGNIWATHYATGNNHHENAKAVSECYRITREENEQAELEAAAERRAELFFEEGF